VTLIVAVGVLTLVANLVIVHAARPFIVSGEAAAPRAAAAIVPGAPLLTDGTPLPLARARIDTAVRLYKQGKVVTLVLSGYPDQVAFMTKYATDAGVPADALHQDPDGLDTYDTMANAVRLFHVKNALVCTQAFHLSRAVYLARSLGIEAVGGTAANEGGSGAVSATPLRELGARVKAFLEVHF
jgi:SanA protein